MRTTTPSYLVQKTHLKQKAFTLRIPQHIHEALNATRERADNAGYVFDVQAVVVMALEQAVVRVDRELIALEQGDEGGVQPAKARRQRGMLKPVSVPEGLK